MKRLYPHDEIKGSNPSPGAHLWETSAYLKLMAVREGKPDKYNKTSRRKKRRGKQRRESGKRIKV
jgi:hypothetical protein